MSSLSWDRSSSIWLRVDCSLSISPEYFWPVSPRFPSRADTCWGGRGRVVPVLRTWNCAFGRHCRNMSTTTQAKSLRYRHWTFLNTKCAKFGLSYSVVWMFKFDCWLEPSWFFFNRTMCFCHHITVNMQTSMNKLVVGVIAFSCETSHCDIGPLKPPETSMAVLLKICFLSTRISLFRRDQNNIAF